jgi:SAM-dependent methyltransferase
MLLTLRAVHSPEHGLARRSDAQKSVELSGGRAHLFHPAADTAAVLVEVDASPGAEFPTAGRGAHAALLARALAAFFPASAGGDSTPFEVEARISALWSPGGDSILRRLFEPLGYAVDAAPIPLDPAQPRSGPSGYWVLGLSGRPRFADLVSHLRVLLPLFDPRPRAERLSDAAALRDDGQRWIETHPARAMVERNLLGRTSGRGHHDLRHDAVLAALRASGARRVLDLGCGTGALLRRLLEEPRFEEVVGVEVVLEDLATARSGLPPAGRGRVMHGSLTYRDPRLAGYDAAALVEVIEHMDPAQLAACEGVVWRTARPTTVVVTTPNAEYDALSDATAGRRHPDHRFEWTRAEFRAWADGVAARHGYEVRYAPAGPEDPHAGPLTQMAVFSVLAGPPPAEDADSSDGGVSLDEVVGERTFQTRRGVAVHVWAEQAAAALEAVSRFSVDPRWLICLPAPELAAAAVEGVGEHPEAALAFYRSRGVPSVAVEELHAGTRAVAVVCRDADAARRRFGVAAGETGAIYTASGQAFFATRAAEEGLLARLRGALDAGGLWEELRTEWIALEGVLEGMPVFREVNPRLRPPAALYLAVGAAERAMLEAEEAALARADASGDDVTEVRMRARERAASNRAYLDACRRAFHPVRSAGELRFAPCRILASREAVHADRDPCWHRERLAPACRAAPRTLSGTEQVVVDSADPTAGAEVAAWWNAIQARGGAGLTVRPRVPAEDGTRLPPVLRCRGEHALRLAHGPGPLADLREAGEAADRSVRAWALSLEALDRFTAGEPVARVHACVFAALALGLPSRR